MNTLQGPSKTPIYYLGQGPEAKALPAFIYLALSGHDSLQLAPYHTPAAFLKNYPLRIFSFTLPGHEEGLDKMLAMQHWAKELKNNNHFLDNFFEKIKECIDWLIETNLILPERLGIGGLSRGGFVATHLAARHKKIRYLIGFAPLTRLRVIQEFSEESEAFKDQMDSLDLTHLTSDLMHIEHLRFYIGNRDERVGTKECFDFVEELANTAHERHVRKSRFELFITQSIGYKGHGTSPEVFEQGSLLIKELLLGR